VVAGVEVFPYAYQLLRDRIHYLHIKDAVRTAEGYEIKPSGEGDGKIAEVLGALRESGYEGFLSIEPHLHNIFTQTDVFAAYREARERGETGVEFVCDGFLKFKIALDALKALLP
jgi:sugar phosphate isomerase/epimerase